MVGVIVLIGWAQGILILKSLIPNAVTMKVHTALSFVISGVMMLNLERKSETSALIGLSAAMGLVMFTVANAYSGYVFNAALGASTDTTVDTITPGLNSLATISCFIAMGIGGTLSILWEKTKSLRVAGWVCFVAGSIACAGHLLHLPFLYYSIDHISTGMAIHTALVFLICGFGLTRVK